LPRKSFPCGFRNGRGEPIVVEQDEHPRATSMEALGKLGTPSRKEGGTVAAGNALGVNDGAAAMILASQDAVNKYGLQPVARIVGGVAAGVEPRTASGAQPSNSANARAGLGACHHVRRSRPGVSQSPSRRCEFTGRFAAGQFKRPLR
jgi:acetyl-CoA acyltransferase